jgi:hypothetical protein
MQLIRNPFRGGRAAQLPQAVDSAVGQSFGE